MAELTVAEEAGLKKQGVTVEMVKGKTPSTYPDVHVGEATFTIGDTNELELVLQERSIQCQS